MTIQKRTSGPINQKKLNLVKLRSSLVDHRVVTEDKYAKWQNFVVEWDKMFWNY